MNNNWEDFKKKMNSDDLKDAPVGRPMSGNFICQICDAFVDDGVYFPVDSVLKWTCEQGHESYADNFRLG